ncbi:hypothetical protein SteCoe_14331 [Stentor coeruleus]|uniref:Uncharacterized protein n=1 Tax=Stentor coeruleus TaxID=5963 RepID=A0A1R2C668_9CILI|nr:hypothetical protein SteCoe_14331 [Stentor coeruleus]
MAEPIESTIETHSEVKKHEEVHSTEHEHPTPIHENPENPLEGTIHIGPNKEHQKSSEPKKVLLPSSVYENLYSKCLVGADDVINNHTFLQPLHRQIKNQGKFHETLLSNYNTVTGDYVNDKVFRILENDVENPKVNWKSRAIAVNDDEIMITGGIEDSTQVFLLNIHNHSTTELPNLHIGRELHCMAWIDFSPAVIGGCSIHGQALDSVEIFGNDLWHPKTPINNKRYGLSACSTGNKTWIFGGANSRNNPILKAEVYENGFWTEINAHLPRGLVGMGAFKVKDEIFILGGFGEDGKNSRKVYVFDTKKEEFSKRKSLSSSASFSQNLWILKDNMAYGFSFKGNEVTYSLE